MDYEIIEIAAGIYHIRHKAEPFHVFCTLVVGQKRALLVDTGPGLYDIRDVTATLTPLPLCVVNTHGHMDHCGGNRFFTGAFMTETDIALRRRTAEIKRRKVINKAEVLPSGFDAEAYIHAPLEDYKPLTDGMSFDLGGRVVEAVALPGHTAGSAGFMSESDGLLLAGDLLGANASLFFDESVTVGEFIKTLERVISLPVQSLVCSHSHRTLDKEDVRGFLSAAESIDKSASVPVKLSTFNEFPGIFSFSKEHLGKQYKVLYTQDKLK